MVCQQTCKSSHKVDSGMRQTIGKIDFIHSSHNIVMWVTRHSVADWVYFRTRTLLATLRTRTQPRRRGLMYLRKPNICHHQLDVQETNVHFTTGLQSLKSFLWMLDCAWMDCLLFIFGDMAIGPRRLVRDRRPFHQKKKNKTNTPTEKRKREIEEFVNCGLRTHQHTFFSRRVSVVHF